MELPNILKIVLDRWRTLVFLSFATLLIGLGILRAESPPAPTRSEVATSQILAAGILHDPMMTALDAAAEANRMAVVLSQAAMSPVLLDSVRSDLGLVVSSEKLGAKVTPRVIPGTSIVEVVVTSGAIGESKGIADSLTKRLVKLGEEYATVAMDGEPVVRVSVLSEVSVREVIAEEPAPAPTGTRFVTIVSLTFLVGILGALLWDHLDPKVRRLRDVERASEGNRANVYVDLSGASILVSTPGIQRIRALLERMPPEAPLGVATLTLTGDGRHGPANQRGTSGSVGELVLAIVSALTVSGKSVLVVQVGSTEISAHAGTGADEAITTDALFAGGEILAQAGESTLVRMPRDEASTMDLMSGPQMYAVTTRFRAMFDHVLFVADPVAHSLTTALFCSLSDAVVTVSRHKHDRKALVSKAFEALRSSRQPTTVVSVMI